MCARFFQIRQANSSCREMMAHSCNGTSFIIVGQFMYVKREVWYRQGIPFCLWCFHILPKTMDLSSSSLGGWDRGRGGVGESRIFRQRMSTNPFLELKVNWCFEMFHTFDNSLTTHFLSSQPRMQRSEDRLNDIEAKIDFFNLAHEIKGK